MLAEPTAATDPAGPTGRLATWAADLKFDDVPAAVTERAKHLLLDGLGCGLIGAQLLWSRVATQAVLDLEGSGDTASSAPDDSPERRRRRSSTVPSSKASNSTTESASSRHLWAITATLVRARSRDTGRITTDFTCWRSTSPSPTRSPRPRRCWPKLRDTCWAVGC
jgi:hypothetical protein